MKYKFGEMDSKKITKRLLITIALIFLLPMILEIFNMIILPGTSGDSTVVKIQALVFIIVGI
ncbi:MAG: hypothetical protein ACRCVJ_06370 [Clostridium sp.]|uniref:hypothetical protein n=1 Tax=Clostridium sp. TaxID=1506 RepID=UPI003F31BF09